MADTLDSNSITALDAQNPGNAGGPIAIPTSGEFGPAQAVELDDYVLPTTAGLASTASVYRILRVSPEIKLKELTLIADGALDSSTGLELNVGAYYSDSTIDGTPEALQGTVISATAFATDVAAFQSSDFPDTNALTNFSQVKRAERLWQALGLSANPGGNIDIVITVAVAATTAVAHNLGLRAIFSK